MHHVLDRPVRRLEAALLFRIATHFGIAQEPELFQQMFLWHYAQPESRESGVISDAWKSYVRYRTGGGLPDFVLVLHAILIAKECVTESSCLPFSQELSPKFWRLVFRIRYGENLVPSDIDSRWDDLFREGLPMYRKLKTASS